MCICFTFVSCVLTWLPNPSCSGCFEDTICSRHSGMCHMYAWIDPGCVSLCLLRPDPQATHEPNHNWLPNHTPEPSYTHSFVPASILSSKYDYTRARTHLRTKNLFPVVLSSAACLSSVCVVMRPCTRLCPKLGLA